MFGRHFRKKSAPHGSLNKEREFLVLNLNPSLRYRGWSFWTGRSWSPTSGFSPGHDGVTPYGGFLMAGGTPSSHPLMEFPWNKPSIFGDLPFMETPHIADWCRLSMVERAFWCDSNGVLGFSVDDVNGFRPFTNPFADLSNGCIPEKPMGPFCSPRSRLSTAVWSAAFQHFLTQKGSNMALLS